MSENETKRGRVLWLWVTLVFVGLIAAWTVLILISVKHLPESVPLEGREVKADG